MTKPIVSVCVQTYQHVFYIKQCLDGILMQQTDFLFEIILGEDESNDGTRDICMDYAKKYPDKIKLFLRSRKDVIYINGNPTGRYNMIENLKSCQGKYIAICEGDDYWTDPLKLQKQVDFLENNPGYVIHSGVAKILKEGNSIKNEEYIGADAVEKSFRVIDFYGRNNLVTCTVLFRNCITNFPIEFHSVIFGDWFLYAVLLCKTKLKAYKSVEVFSVYRVHDKGIMKSLSEISLYKQHIYQVLIIKKYIGYEKYPLEVIQWINNYSIPKFRVELNKKMYRAALNTFLVNLNSCKTKISIKRYLSVIRNEKGFFSKTKSFIVNLKSKIKL